MSASNSTRVKGTAVSSTTLKKKLADLRGNPALEGALFSGSQLVALLDQFDRLFGHRDRTEEKASRVSGGSHFGKEIVIGAAILAGELFAVGALASGANARHFADPEGLSQAVQGGKKQRGGTDIMQVSCSQTNLAIVSPGALKPRNQ